MMNRRFLILIVLHMLAASTSMASQTTVSDDEVKLLVKGQAAFDAIIENIRTASESIVVNMFIWRDDRIGNRIASELLNAADRGVTIHISKDLYGVLHEYSEETKLSFFHKDAPASLKLRSQISERFYPEQGVHTHPVQQPSQLLQSLLAHKNITIERDRIEKDHSKYFIFDNKRLIMGGINIEDKEIYRDILGKQYFDYMVYLDGADHVKSFYQDMLAPTNSERDIRFIHNRRESGHYACKASILDLLDSARSSLVICNAYWGDADVLNKVIAKVNEGLDVSVFIAAESNIKNDLNQRTMKRLYDATNGSVHIYLSSYMLHAKAMVCDKTQYWIGSCNFNRSSLATYSEANVLLSNPPAQFRESFSQSLDDLKAHSRLVTSSEDFAYNGLTAWVEAVQASHYGMPLLLIVVFLVIGIFVFACHRLLRKAFKPRSHEVKGTGQALLEPDS